MLQHGGFDSLIEEFFPICQRIAAAGFDVIAFEGPGQGGARTLNGLTFDHDWEKPVGAVLDHFRLDRAALVGISMGGYWALRAAGREPRIHSVVAWPPGYGAEQADQHCQMGNLELACEVLTTWLQAAGTNAGPAKSSRCCREYLRPILEIFGLPSPRHYLHNHMRV